MKNKATRILSIFLACLMLFVMVGCGTLLTETNTGNGSISEPLTTPESPEPTENDFITEGDIVYVDTLIDTLREKYADFEKVNYQEILWNVPDNQEFFVDFAFDLIEDTEYENFFQIIAVYADVELTQRVTTEYELATHDDDSAIPEGHNRVYIRPEWGGHVSNYYYDLITGERIDLDESSKNYLYKKEYNSWGFLNNYYLVQHIDAVTAETLDKPLVTIFTVENNLELEAPKSEFYVTDDGKAAFRWNEIPGADYYLIVELQGAPFNTIDPIDRVTGTNWEYPHAVDTAYMNSTFYKNYAYGNPGDYSVIAVNSRAHSQLGTIHRGEYIAQRLPYSLDLHSNWFDSEGKGRAVPSIGLLPVRIAIEMADGTTVYRRLIYDFDNTEVKEERWFYCDGEDEKGDFINPRFIEHTNLYINYIVEGTLFTGSMIVVDVDQNTAAAEIDAFCKILDEVLPRGGSKTSAGVKAVSGTTNTKTQNDAPEMILLRQENNVYASSALSEFLALNLLVANEMIDLSKFPESADREYLMDAFFEALYQNPLAPRIDNAYIIQGTSLLFIEYRESQRRIYEQQVALRGIIPEIVAEVITPIMTDLEKSFAINQYLIDNSEYDWAALEEAERNDFQTVDTSFNDSFTAYGILINGVGVCSGYADAFKLLADEAGLEAIVVTGYLEGNVPHAWNRVYIDGQWYSIDVTNNANEYWPNAFLNLPDYAAGKLLVEDNQFMMDAFIPRYRSHDNSNEYYTVTERFFNINEVSGELARQISAKGSITLRTDYDLDDETFYEIAMKVMEILGISEIYGFHMLGVIWMSDTV